MVLDAARRLEIARQACDDAAGAPVADAIIGREDELAALAAFVETPAAWPGALVLEGEAGAGKTTLWRAGHGAASRSGLRVLQTRPFEHDTALAFLGLSDLLERDADEVTAELPEPQRRALAVALLREGAGEIAPDQRAVSAAVLGALRTLARTGPVLVAIDDVQWLDVASASVLRHAAARLGDEPVGFLVALRHPLRDPLELERALPEARAQRVPVGALSLGALNELLRRRAGLALPRPALRRLHEQAGGNAFYALELAGALRRAGMPVGPGEPLPVPDDLDELLRARLAELPVACRAALAVAAALSQPTHELVAAAGEDAAALDAAFEAGILELDGDRFRFAHPLLAAAAYREVGPVRRKRLHSRLAELSVDAEERARHLAHATSKPDPAVASALEGGARHADARGARAAAAELLEHARRLSPADGDDALRLGIEAAGRHFEAGDPARARGLLETVAAAASGARRAHALTRLARVHAFEADLRVAVDLYREALAGEAAPDIRAEAEEGLAVALMRMLTDLPAAAELSAAAAVRARAISDRAAEGEFLATEALVRTLLGDPAAEALMSAAAKLEDAPGSGSPFLSALWGPSFMVAVRQVWTGDHEHGRSRFAVLYRRGVELGDEGSLPLVLRYRSYAEWLGGDWDAAARSAREGIEVARQTGQPSQQAVLSASLALVEAHRGRAEEADLVAREALALADVTGSGFARVLAEWALGALALAAGDAAGADRVLGPALARLAREGVREPGAASFVADEVEALVALGRLEDAAALLDELEANAVVLGRKLALGDVLRGRALMAVASGDLERSAALLEQALETQRGLGVPYWRARTLLELGGVLRRSRRGRAARAALTEAEATFERLGARVWAGRARAEAARLGGRAPGTDVLTPTEQRVADLVAEGLSNREIAAALFVTTKTVEFHLRNIFRKAGVRSRAQLAATRAASPEG